MKARFLKSGKMRELAMNIERNLDLYRSGSFGFISDDPDNYFESDDLINDQLLSEVDSGDCDEVNACLKVYEAVGGISEYLARDERLWVYLTHTSLLRYSRGRWPIPDDTEKAIKHIRIHFFCSGARGIERDNAASRLWWMAALCNRCRSIDLRVALTCFLFQSDVRANIIERPTTAQNVRIFESILRRLDESLHGSRALYQREIFRAFMKSLNLQGGVKLLAVLPPAQIENILDKCLVSSN